MKNNHKSFDVVIIGGGPAGLTCAIYAARANLSVCFIEKGAPGGKMTKTFTIENWSGDQEVHGYQLSLRMLNHAKKTGAEYIYGNVIKIDPQSQFKQYSYLEDGSIIESKALVIATGMENRKPLIKNMEKFEFKGLSYCVICDATLYKDLPGAIIGGGDSAFEEATYLASVASKVYLLIRKDHPRAEATLVNKVRQLKNVEIIYQAQVLELIGEEKLEKIKYIQNGQEKFLDVNHIYPYIGFDPTNQFAKHLDIFDEAGFILTNEEMQTKIPGLYAIGDIRQKQVRQIVTAAADGSIVGKLLASKIK